MKKIITIILILLMTIGVIIIPTQVKASFSIDKADLYSKGFHNNNLHFGGIGLAFEYVVYKKDGVEYPAYCLNRTLGGVTSEEPYSVSIEELLTDVGVWRAIVNGFPYKTPEELGCNTKEEAFFATKQAVYCMIYNRDPHEYTATDAESERTLNALIKIVNDARNSNEVKQSADLEIKEVGTKWEQDKIDKNYISKTFTVSAKARISSYTARLDNMNIEGAKIVDEKNIEKNKFNYGEKFKIIIPIKNMQKEGNLNIIAEGKVATKPILYGYSANRNKQDYAITGSIYEDGNGVRNVQYTKNETKIIIQKYGEDGKLLQGVKFNLLDENKNVVYSEIVTNEEGKAIIENLNPGKYYIEETKPANGYAVYEELIEADVAYNEALTVKITNLKENITVEKPEISESQIEAVQKLPKTGM